MSFNEYTQILEIAFKSNVIDYLFTVMLILFIPFLCFVIDKTLLKGQKRDKETAKWVLVALFIAVITLLYARKTLPMLKDLNDEQYICVHGEYYNYSDKSSYDGALQITPDIGETIQMWLPKKMELPRTDQNRFPLGKYTGTVWYAKNSHYILEFIPDEPIDNN